jgi:hypothetical protein
MPSPNYELLAAPATWDDDILCGLDFSPPPFDPYQYASYRWVGTVEMSRNSASVNPPTCGPPVVEARISAWRPTVYQNAPHPPTMYFGSTNPDANFVQSFTGIGPRIQWRAYGRMDISGLGPFLGGSFSRAVEIRTREDEFYQLIRGSMFFSGSCFNYLESVNLNDPPNPFSCGTHLCVVPKYSLPASPGGGRWQFTNETMSTLDFQPTSYTPADMVEWGGL